MNLMTFYLITKSFQFMDKPIKEHHQDFFSFGAGGKFLGL